MAEQVPPRRARLGAKLREIRTRRYSSGSAFARRVGWVQSKVSKIERGAQLPSDADLDTWLTTTDPSELDRAEVVELLGEARLAYLTFEDRWRTPGAIAADQREIAEEERRCSVIREYQPALLPGLVQTPAYAKEMLSSAGGVALLGAGDSEIDALVRERLERQQLLYTPGKQIRLLIGEPALRTRFGSEDVMAGQLDRLLTIAAFDAVEVVVLPLAQPYPLIPVSGFAVLDDALAVIETYTGQMKVEAESEIQAFTAAFEVGMSQGVPVAEFLR
jgi:transcriptional regulator with XRE-family HTH domain